MNHDPHQLDLDSIRLRFDRAADSFDDVDFAHAETRDGLLARLLPMQLNVKTVLDLGCATGTSAYAIAKQFRKARVLAVDVSSGMLENVHAKRGWRSRVSPVQADATALPVADHSVDIVFSNMLLPWISNPDALFQEVGRVLRKDGLFLFSSLGPDSLGSLAHAFAAVDDHQRVNAFPDMHDVGDGLVRSGLRDPVLDVDRLTISYKSPVSLFADLTAMGARNCRAVRRRGLLGRKTFTAAIDRLPRDADGQIPVELELVYGHAWGSGQSGNDFRVDATTIPLRRR